jgi:methanogenic corrinoid protein MtbC1
VSDDDLALIDAFRTALLTMDRLQVRALMQPEGKPHVSLGLMERLIVPALDQIGAAWTAGTVALSQVYMSGRICEDLVNAMNPGGDALQPHQPRIALAVLEDYHLLGKRMVYSVLRASGYRLIDYGVTDAEQLAIRTVDDGVEVLLISTLMLRSALRVGRVKERLTALGSPARIAVGGAPFRLDDRLWLEVGADACGRTASDAVHIVARLAGEAR